MLRYIATRGVLALITTFAISLISFAIIQLTPGDYVDAYIAQLASGGGYVSEQAAENLRREYGLDQPIYVQYGRWVGRFLQGDFGFSMEWRRPVSDVIGDRLLLTIAVSVTSLLFMWMVALPVGIYSAVRQYSTSDYVFTFLGLIGLAIPNFLLALLIMYFGNVVFNAHLGGLFSPEYAEAPWTAAKIGDLLSHLPVPGIVLGLAGTAQLIRIMRANLLDELRKPYVVTARAKGMSRTRAILKYPVRVALNPFASTAGYTLPYIVSGTIVVSLVFGLPTVGPVLLGALTAKDMFLAGTIVLLLGGLTVLGTFVSDLLLLWIDPRIRLEG
jgi:peptide/nickel transport system permease protein